MTVAIEEARPATRNVVMAQVVLALGGLFIGTGEFAAMGLLPNIATAVDVTVPQAGHLISAYALGVVVGSPVLAVLAAKMEKRKLLILLAILISVGNAASAVATDLGLLAAARFLAGLPHGAYYGTASIVVASLVPREKRAQAISNVMLGFAAANLIGVPLTTLLGQLFGWRSAFAMIAVGGALVAILLPLTVPKLNADQDASPLSEVSGMRGMQVWLTLLTAAIGFAGMFAIYSYITPTLVETTGQPETRVPAFLALWGLGMVVGNVLGGWLTDRSQTLAIGGMLVWNMIVLGLFMPAAGNGTTAALSLFVIGTGFALVPALQTRLMDVAPKAQSLAAAMNHSAFNLSNAIGAWTGGLAISAGWGWSSTGAVAAALAFLGLLAFIVAISIEKRSKADRT